MVRTFDSKFIIFGAFHEIDMCEQSGRKNFITTWNRNGINSLMFCIVFERISPYTVYYIALKLDYLNRNILPESDTVLAIRHFGNIRKYS